jgi:hypothetical protein
VLLVGTLDCASSPLRGDRGELLLQVETNAVLGYIEFIRPETGDAARAIGIPEGESEHTIPVGSGEWCLFEISLGTGAVGYVLRPGSLPCIDVEPGATARWGGLRIDGQNVNFFALPLAAPRE